MQRCATHKVIKRPYHRIKASASLPLSQQAFPIYCNYNKSFSTMATSVGLSPYTDTSESQENQNKYKEIFSTLSTGHGWKVADHLYQYQGFWCFPFFLEGVMSVQQHFKAKPSDIIVSGAPKTGTTWLKALTFAIVTRTHFSDSTNPLLSKVSHELIPNLEIEPENNRNPEIPLLATPIPYTSLPKSIIDTGCKIVYICRDPKAAFISLWHFVGKMKPRGEEPLPLKEAFELYCQGVSNFGPYWDHVLSYWRASLECPDKVLFLKYEDLKDNTLFYVKRLAEFMGYPFSLEEERLGVVQKIVNLCSFDYMSNLEVNKHGKHHPKQLWAVENNVYFRQGKIGDWKNYLTDEMAARLDEITKQKFNGSGLVFQVSSNA